MQCAHAEWKTEARARSLKCRSGDIAPNRQHGSLLHKTLGSKGASKEDDQGHETEVPFFFLSGL
jgi:hypothetical protein